MKNPDLLAMLHVEWRGVCAIEDDECVGWHSLHHFHKHPRDDVRANLGMLCGDGTTGHHGLIESHDPDTCRALGVYLVRHRPDFLEYLGGKLGGLTAVAEWMRTQLYWTDVLTV